jgi:hypothetical protein
MGQIAEAVVVARDDGPVPGDAGRELVEPGQSDRADEAVGAVVQAQEGSGTRCAPDSRLPVASAWIEVAAPET